MMAGNHAIGNGRLHRFENRVDDGHRKRHPPAHSGRFHGADHGSGREFHRQWTKAALVDGIVRVRVIVECDELTIDLTEVSPASARLLQFRDDHGPCLRSSCL
jgi:hypothetical protein